MIFTGHVFGLDFHHYDHMTIGEFCKDRWNCEYNQYINAVNIRPIEVKAITSGTVYAAGDVISQLI